MSRTRGPSVGVAVGLLLGLVWASAPPPPANAGFNVGAQIGGLSSPLCGSQGGTSVDLVQGSKLAGIEPNEHVDSKVITRAFDGPNKLEVDAQGELAIQTATGDESRCRLEKGCGL